ncbi:MAG: Bug family tripartite tricarboxylate transporter substrate binding protein [Burkholderiales bacterium]
MKQLSMDSLAAMAALMVSVCAAPVLAQSAAPPYPSKPIRLVISYPAGGGIDLTARAIAQKLGESLSQTVIVDNRVGGNTIVSAEFAARAAPDGYTLFMPLDSTMTQYQALYEKLPYDPVRDFVPITRVSRTNSLLVTHPKAPFRTLEEFVAYGRANPGKLNFAASATTTRLVGEILKSTANIDMVFVPYKGSAPMIPALMSAEIDLVIDGMSAYVPAIKQGKLRPVALAGPVRNPHLPDTPTTREAGYPQIEASGWLGVFAPAGTPAPIISRLNTELVNALKGADLGAKLEGMGITVVSSTPEELAALLRADIAKWSPVIKARGIKAD